VHSADPGTSPVLDDLTAREREILQVVAEGLDNHEIAARLDISEKTVRNHVSTIFSKLQLRSRAQAVALARDAGYGRRAR
jgi:DNA-binding NarL/FixJ family response regulator